MDAGYIVLVNSKGIVPAGIKWFTNSQFSHSLVTMPDLLGFPMCIEAEEGGVDMSRFDLNYTDNTKESYQVWKINLPQATKEQALKQIINTLEVGYGYLEYIWFIWRKLNSLVGRDIKNQNNWIEQGLICSQLVVAYINACGIGSTLDGYGKGSIAPKDLYNIMVTHPETFTLIQHVRM